MDIRQVTDRYCVAPQIDPSDMQAIAAAGITHIIDNRPDAEIPASHHARVMEEAAKEAGLGFVHLPITHDTMTPEKVAAQKDAAQAPGKVLAYCASGTRSTVIWALGQAQGGSLDVDTIIETAAKAGYDISGMRPLLQSLAGG